MSATYVRIYADVSMNNWNHVPRYLTNNYSEILERGKFDTLTHKYMTSHFPDFVHALQ